MPPATVSCSRGRRQVSRRADARRALFRNALSFCYADNPCAYAEDVLGVTLTPQQQSILEALRQPPYKVAVPASTNAGKSYLAAVAVSWWFDTHVPSIVLTTGPKLETVRDCIWRELRVLRAHLPFHGFPGPGALRLQDDPDHWAAGMVAKDGTRFQGRHSRYVLIIFDEATGIPGEFWDRALPMLQGDQFAFLAIGNPTSTASRFYAEVQSGDYTVLEMSALDHPNIAAESAGLPAPYPSAVRLATLDAMLRKWSTPVAKGEQRPTDVEWPLGSGEYLRPGPEAEGLLLGRWPSQATNSVWSQLAWEATLRSLPDIGPLEIGADIARFGEDSTAIHVRKGPSSLDHLTAHGLDLTKSADLIRKTADDYGARHRIMPTTIKLKIDDAGLGGGVTDLLRAWKYNVVPCLGANKAIDPKLYPNRRSESFFTLKELADSGQVSFARLSSSVRNDLRKELLGVTYTIPDGRRTVEPKAETKKRLKKSPDNADAVVLAYAQEGPSFKVYT